MIDRGLAARAGGTRKRMAWCTSGLLGEELARDDVRVLRQVRVGEGAVIVVVPPAGAFGV